MNGGGWEGLNISTLWLGMLLGLPHYEVAGWGGIYSHQPNCSRWEGCWRWVHQTVRCASHVTQLLGFWRFWPLELLLFGAPDSPVPHQTGTVLSAHCSTFAGVRCSRSLRWSRCSAGTPDSPVAHRTVRWIIAERLSRNPMVKSLSRSPLVHRTLSGAPDQGSLRFLLLLSFEP
jgi:hypothetical protein